jgi:hypothetical protein
MRANDLEQYRLDVQDLRFELARQQLPPAAMLLDHRLIRILQSRIEELDEKIAAIQEALAARVSGE